MMQKTQNKTNNEQNNAVANQIEKSNSDSEQSLNAPEYDSSKTNNVFFQMKAGTGKQTNSETSQESGNFLNQMQSAFQTDFSDVNFYKDSKTASDIGALAFTQGNNVHFAPGQFKPDTQSGKELIGHELTHVVQQRKGKVKPTKQIGKFNINDNSGLEKEADIMGAKAARYTPVQAKTISGFSGNTINATNQPIQRFIGSSTDFETHKKMVDTKMANINENTICPVSVFKDITYSGLFTGAGITKKKSIEILQNIHDKIFINNKTGEKATNFKELSKDNLLKIQHEFIVLRKFTNEWLANRKKDTSRKNRAYGYKKFNKYLELAIKKTEINLIEKKVSEKDIKKNVKESVEDERIKNLKTHYKNRNANSILTNLVPIVKKLAPEKGTSAQINVEVEIPVEPSGVGFLGGNINLNVENGDDGFKTRAELCLTGGASLKIFKIKGEIGGYIEAQGDDAKRSLNLISYGMHKRFKEAGWPSEVADYAWGGKSNAQKFEKTIEDTFDKDSKSYVELGGIAGATASVEAGVVEAEVSAKGNMSKRYDKDTKGGLKGKKIKGFGLGGKVNIAKSVSGEFSYNRRYTDSVLTKSELEFKVSSKHAKIIKPVEIVKEIQGALEKVEKAVKKEENIIVNIEKEKATAKIKEEIEKQLGIKTEDNGISISVTFNLIDKELEISISTTSGKSVNLLGVVEAEAEFSKKEFSKTLKL